MKARPIIFSGPMVRANLREIEAPGTGKTQTRRIVKPQPYFDERHGVYVWDKSKRHAVMANGSPTTEASLRRMLPRLSPYGQPGDVLWVRERIWQSFKAEQDHEGEYNRIWTRNRVEYFADGIEAAPRPATPGCTPMMSRPSIHMPRWASRITLEVTDIRVERLQDISESDARAEGVELFRVKGGVDWWRDYRNEDRALMFPSVSFQTLWKSINGPDSWAANSWVWVISYRPHLMNVDEFLKREAA